MTGIDPRIRQLKIKTGVCKRSGKEKASYQKEAEQQKAKIEKMKADNEDEYKIKKMHEVLGETQQMVPDCHRRLVAARADLEKMIEELEPDFGQSDEKEEADKDLVAAKQVLQESEAYLPDEEPKLEPKPEPKPVVETNKETCSGPAWSVLKKCPNSCEASVTILCSFSSTNSALYLY